MIEKLNGLQETFFLRCLQTSHENSPRTAVEFKSGHIRRGLFYDGGFLLGREFGLQLVSDGLSNVALDGEDIHQIAIV